MKRTLSLFVAMLLVLSLSACGRNNGEKFRWDDIELGSLLPAPKSYMGRIITNYDDRLSIYIYKTSRDGYKDYVSECKAMGFTIESDNADTSYSAYNEAGYKLDLWYNGNDEELRISLDAPMEMTTIQWPTNELVSLLPVPLSNIGVISSESSDRFFVYVGKTSIEDYNTYVNACSESGFSVDYQKGDDFYYADNTDGYHISLNYQGNNVMSVEIEKPEEAAVESIPSADGQETSSTDVPEPVADEAAGSADGVRPEFQEAMDSYEAFYDEYCDFLKKYSEDPTDLELLAEYGNMMSRLSDMNEKFEAWENEDLNSAELKYYLEVSGRVAQKLIGAAA